MSKGIINIYQFKQYKGKAVPAYMMVSTANVNVENDSREFFEYFESQCPDLTKMKLDSAIQEIAKNVDFDAKDIELVIAIHGYNTDIMGVKNWFRDIAAFANKDPIVNQKTNRIFIGYRWPSENFSGNPINPLGKRIKELFTALPRFPLWLIACNVTAYLALAGVMVYYQLQSRFLIGLAIAGITLCVLATSLILALIVLRLSLYFRDSYRANHYAVPDLVEIIRQMDKTLMIQSPGKTWSQKQEFWSKRKIKLTFLGHSMGGFVVTNAVRILSDVFDPNSIGNLSRTNNDKEPENTIGNTFKLGRLILVSPDIPMDSILEGRANFLSSSLRRFEESYLFSNEGDLALRLASTAANYFSYPARTRTRGYRLGNVSVTDREYGIVNLESIKNTMHKHKADTRLQNVTIGYGVKGTLPILSTGSEITADIKKRSIAELFTFVDCTDYYDTTTYPKKEGQRIGVVSYSAQKEMLGLIQYIQLAVGYFLLGKDVHGGYFRGDYVTEMMYRIAFVGFKEYLKSVTPNRTKLINGFDILSENMQDKRIQTVLSPERYANIAKESFERGELV